MCLDWDEWKRSHTTEETLTTCLESHTFCYNLKSKTIVTTFSCTLSGNHLGVRPAWVQHKYIYVSYSHFHEDLPTMKASRLLLLLIGSYLLGEEAPGNRDSCWSQLPVTASGVLACCLQPSMNCESLLPKSETVWKAKDGYPPIWFGPTTWHWDLKHRATIPMGWRALSQRARSWTPSPPPGVTYTHLGACGNTGL